MRSVNKARTESCCGYVGRYVSQLRMRVSKYSASPKISAKEADLFVFMQTALSNAYPP